MTSGSHCSVGNLVVGTVLILGDECPGEKGEEERIKERGSKEKRRIDFNSSYANCIHHSIYFKKPNHYRSYYNQFKLSSFSLPKKFLGG